MRRELVALSRYSLTPEDRAIFERFTCSQTESRYHIADVHALIRTTGAIHAFGSVVEYVVAMELAQRSIELGRPA